MDILVEDELPEITNVNDWNCPIENKLHIFWRFFLDLLFQITFIHGKTTNDRICRVAIVRNYLLLVHIKCEAGVLTGTLQDSPLQPECLCMINLMHLNALKRNYETLLHRIRRQRGLQIPQSKMKFQLSIPPLRDNLLLWPLPVYVIIFHRSWKKNIFVITHIWKFLCGFSIASAIFL